MLRCRIDTADAWCLLIRLRRTSEPLHEVRSPGSACRAATLARWDFAWTPGTREVLLREPNRPDRSCRGRAGAGCHVVVVGKTEHRAAAADTASGMLH